MSGHSKWSTIKRKKAQVDTKKAKVFNKVIRELTVAAREGGGDPEANPRLRVAIDNSRAVNMPHDNVDRAIKKGTGELPGAHYESSVYEGYGPGGIAIYIEVLTDNRNRTVAEVRHIMDRNGGRLGENGCVAWMFRQKGQIFVDRNRYNEDAILDIALECGAEDVLVEDEYFIIVTSSHDFMAVKERLGAKGISFKDSELSMVPSTMVKVEDRDAEKVLRLMEALEDHDDIQRVSSNFDIDEEIIRKLGS